MSAVSTLARRGVPRIPEATVSNRIKRVTGGLLLLSLLPLLSGCFVGETTALVVQAPFEVVDLVVPGDVVSDVGATAGWITDLLIPF